MKTFLKTLSITLSITLANCTLSHNSRESGINLFQSWTSSDNDYMTIDFSNPQNGTFTVPFLDRWGEGCVLEVTIDGDGVDGNVLIHHVTYYGDLNSVSRGTCEFA